MKAKAVILATSRPQRIWTFSTELRGFSTFRPPSDAGNGCAINTGDQCTVVDPNGKEVTWVDCNGRVLETVSKRCRPAADQKFFIMGGGSSSLPHRGFAQYSGPKPTADLEERMRRGEFVPICGECTHGPIRRGT